MNNSLNDKTILLIGTGTIKKRFIMQKIKKLGLEIVALNKEKNWASPYVNHWVLADNTNHSDSISALEEFLAGNPNVKINGVLTFWEDDVLLTSKIIDRFNLVGIPYSIAKKVRNKYLFREFCRTYHIPAPNHCLIRKEEDLKDVLDSFEFPVVIKPAFGSSSAYVIKVDNKDNLDKMYQLVKNNISTSVESALSDGLDIFIEEFIDGDEVDIDILLQNGKIKFCSISDNYNKSRGIFFIDSGQAIPSSLPVHAQQEIIERSEMTLEKLGIQNGCVHFEAKYSSKGFYPIEVNLRMGGDYVYSYIRSAWGVDLIEYIVKIAIGEYIPKISLPSTPKKYIIGWDLHPDQSGILVELENLDNLKRNKNVEEVGIYKTIGDPILVPPEGFEHLGWITVAGENILDAKDNLEEILKLISYKVIRFDPESALGKTERKSRFSPAVFNKNLLIRTARIEAVKKAGINDSQQLKIGILFNKCEGVNDPINQQLSRICSELENEFKFIGYKVTIINLNNFLEAIDILKKGDIDLVFNIGESIYNDMNYKPQITALLDVFQIPYAGSNFSTFLLATDKIRFKKILAYHDIPTPAWDYAYKLDDQIDEGLEYPLIVKPANSDYCLGISQNSVVADKEELSREIKKVITETKKPALIEEYIGGDEYEVYILGNEEENLRVLPLSRIIFDDLGGNFWHINTYESRWLDSRLRDKIIYQLPPKNITKKLESLITEIALDTYNIFGCKDYGKVEIKIDHQGNPYVLELTPNPWLCDSKNQGIVAAAKLVGINFSKLLEEIIRLSTNRYKHQFFKIYGDKDKSNS